MSVFLWREDYLVVEVCNTEGLKPHKSFVVLLLRGPLEL